MGGEIFATVNLPASSSQRACVTEDEKKKAISINICITGKAEDHQGRH